MAATKEAILAKEHEPGLDVTIFFLDLRAFGKDFDRYCDRAKNRLGVRYVRSFISRTFEMPEREPPPGLCQRGNEAGRGGVRHDCALAGPGAQREPPPAGRADAGGAQPLGLRPDQRTSPHGHLAAGCICRRSVPGAQGHSRHGHAGQRGGCQGHGRSWPRPGERRSAPSATPRRDIADEPPRVGVFVCHCGSNIASVVDVEAVVRATAALPYVALAEHNVYTCADDSQDRIKARIAEYRLNRVVVASCTPRTHEPIFRDTLRSAGLNPYLLDMANIRDQCSWVHSGNPGQATAKAIDLVRMAAARAAQLVPLIQEAVPVNNAALVVGGGIAGMTAALALADQGFPVHLVEISGGLGGTARQIHKTLDGGDLDRLLTDTARPRADPSANLRIPQLAASKVSGHIGNFSSVIDSAAGPKEIEHGAIVVATGATEKKPGSFGYGASDRVITQLELSDRLGTKALHLPAKPTVVMIQCVEQRSDDRPYCSRVCCTTAVRMP